MADNSPIAKEISAVENWLAAIDVIRTNLKLPDLTTSSGLRQVARSPHKVFPRLEKAYTDHLKDPLVLGALALIWGRIWTERRARQALYDTGFLINIIRLITTTPDCRVPALQSLVTIVHHASQGVLTDIAHRTTRTLLLLLRSDTESPIIHELITIILTHATAPGPSLDVLKSDGIDYTSLIQALSRAVRRQTATRTMQTHFLGFLRGIASRLHFNLAADPSSIHFLVAHFPSTNFAIRGDVILALNDLHSSGAEHERSTWDPNAYHKAALAAQTELSDDILERMEVQMGGTLLTSDIYVNTRATEDFQDAMAAVLEDKDMYALAKKLYPLILATESSIPQGAFRDKHGELIPIEELGLPFSSFIDALPHAADAIRMRGIPTERLAADVLEVKHALLTRQHSVVQQICEERIETDAHVGFFYYALVLSASSSSGDEGRRMPTAERLKLAKRGLMCEGTTAYIRLGLHKVAAECAYKLGMGRLKVAAGPAMGPVRASDRTDEEDSDEEEELSPRRMLQYYTEAIVFFTSALDDARDYSKTAPLDYRLYKNVLLMQTILSLVLEGEGKRELEPVLAQQEIVDQLYTTLYSPTIPKSQSRLAVDAIVPNWENAQREWDGLLRKFDRRAPTETQDLSHLHAIAGELQGELEAETDFKDRPPTYISTLDIPALTHPRSTTPSGPPMLDSDKARDEANLRQAYATLAAWMQGSSNKSLSSSMSGLTIPAFSPTSPSPITPGPETPHSSLPPPTVSPCILDRRPYVDVHAIPVVQYRCYACGNPSDGSDLKTCSGCRRTKYCDEVCQKKHWINGHGDECLPDTL